SVSRHLQRQDASAIVADGGGNPARDALLDQKDYTAATAGATCLGSETPIFCRDRDELINQRRGNPRGVSAAQLPFFTKQASDFFPIPAHGGLVHRPADFAVRLEIAMNVFASV